MQVTLNIDASNFGATIEQVFAQLTEQDKRELAKEVMLKVLQSPNDAERKAKEREVIQQLLDSPSDYIRRNIKTEEDARNSYEFKDKMKGFKSSSDIMFEEIVKAVIAHYKEMVVELVKEDEQIQAMRETFKEHFIKEFPNLIQMVMAQYFVANMGNIANALNMASSVSLQTASLGHNLKAALAAQGININL